MASSSVIQNDTVAPSSSGALCASPSTSSGNRESDRTVVDDYQTSYSTWIRSSPCLPPSPLVDDGHHRDNFTVKTELTSSPGFRSSRLPTVPSNPQPSTSHSLKAAIPAFYTNTYTYARQDVRDLVNNSASLSTVPRSNAQSTFGTSVSNPQHSQHVLTKSSERLRTPAQALSTTELIAHYGIPQFLPPAPRPTTRTPVAQPPSPRSPVTDFQSLSQNYISMLSKPADNTMPFNTAEMDVPLAPALDEKEMDAVFADFFSFQDAAAPQPTPYTPSMGDEFLTSPLDDFGSPDDTPYDDFLQTPVLPDMNITSEYDDSMALFADMSTLFQQHQREAEPVKSIEPSQLDKLYKISPGTPALDFLDSASLYPTPRLPSDLSSFPSPAPSNRRKSSATGTRKGVTPESLVPVDAPTQPRNYAFPSATSRKEVPLVFARKRARSQAFGDEEDELPEEPLGPNATEKEQIEWKRRQNTLAARKSRKRKLMHQQELEDNVDRLTKERDTWKTRALTLQQMLQSAGVPFLDFED